MQNLKNKTNELIYKAETDSQTQNQSVMTVGRGEGEEQERGRGLGGKTIMYKMNALQGVLYSTGNIVNILQ